MKKVGIIMGSDSDLPIVKKATDMLSTLDIPFEVHVYSAHRTPVEARDFALNARKNGFGVLLAAAGMGESDDVTPATYLNANKSKVVNGFDRYIRTTVSRVKINTDSGSRGGGFSGGGGHSSGGRGF